MVWLKEPILGKGMKSQVAELVSNDGDKLDYMDDDWRN